MPDNVTPAEAAMLQPRQPTNVPLRGSVVRKDGETNENYFARLARARKMQSSEAPKQPVHKEDVSPAEYQKRWERAQRRDNSLVEADKKRRIEAATAAWNAKVGPTFADAHTDRPDVLERVNRLVTGTGRHQTSMVFYGPVGTGKSWQGWAYISEAMKRGALTPGQVIADTEISIIGDIAAGGWQRTQKIKELQEPRNQLYFIDDVGQAYFSREEARTEAWFSLINHIYNRQLTLLLTTNLKPNEQSLGAWLGVRAWDRLQALIGGGNGFVTLGSVNKRPRVAEQNEQRYRDHTGPAPTPRGRNQPGPAPSAGGKTPF